MLRKILILLLSVYSSTGLAVEAAFRVAFFIPHDEGRFWYSVEKVMDAACDSLKCEIIKFQANGNQYKMLEQFREIASSEEHVDFSVFQSFKKNGIGMLEIAEKYHIPSFIFNAGLTDNQRERVGGPRENFKYWIGEMLPDDEGAGATLLNELVKISKQKLSGELEILAVNGHKSDGAAIHRLAGFVRSLKSHQNLKLGQVLRANWSRTEAEKKVHAVRARYQDANIIWAANDNMAFGAYQALKNTQHKIGEDLFIGGIDWEPEALQMIKQNKMAVSVGGHFLEGAWILVMLHDYFHGKDFKQEKLQFKSSMGAITAKNLDRALPIIEQDNWAVFDYGKFSKLLYPEIKQYDFSFENLLHQL